MLKDEFKALQAKWYKKLQANGFEDIEQDEVYLKKTTGFKYTSKNGHNAHQAQVERLQYFLQKQEYFILAGQFLHEHDFASKTEKRLWQLHSEGFSLREIAKKLKYREKSVVGQIINKLKIEMLKGL